MLTPDMQRLITDFPAGSVATIRQDGCPAVSPKATFVVLDAYTLAFGNIRSAGTIKNIAQNPAIEICFTDILSRKAVRVTGHARNLPRAEASDALKDAYAASWAPYAPHVRSYVQIQVQAAELIVSPAYDVGFRKRDLQETNLEKLQQIVAREHMPRSVPDRVPYVVFKTRRRDETSGEANPYCWQDLTTHEIFAGRNIVLFAVPGAFTPACSDAHLPGYEENHAAFRALGIDQVICLSVNDPFVMFQWARARNIQNVFMLPDGNGAFSEKMGMLIDRSTTGMGLRSWRYAMHVKNGHIRKLFCEPGQQDNPASIPVQVSDAGTMLAYLREA